MESLSVQPIRAESAVPGLRATFDARLARVKLRYQVDVGLGDAVFPPATELVPGGLLGFAMASVRAYTPYTASSSLLALACESRGIAIGAKPAFPDYSERR